MTPDTGQRPDTTPEANVTDLDVARRRAALTAATAQATTAALTSAHRWAGRRAALRTHRACTATPRPLPERWARWWPHRGLDHSALARWASNGPRWPVTVLWQLRARRQFRRRSAWALAGLAWTIAAVAGAALALALLVTVAPVRAGLWVAGEVLVLRGWHRPPRRSAVAQRDVDAFAARRQAEIRTAGALQVPAIGPAAQPYPAGPTWEQTFTPTAIHYWPPAPFPPGPAPGWNPPPYQPRRRFRLSPAGRLVIGLLIAAYIAYLAFIAVGIGETLEHGPPPDLTPATSDPEATP